MKSLKKASLFVGLALVGAGALATTTDVFAKGGSMKPGQETIVEIVLKDDGEFDVLQAAVVKAGLVDALNGKGQYTVFAPTDEAFAEALGEGGEAMAIAAVESLPVDKLTNILLYHVTEGRRNSTSVLAAPEYTMLNGAQLTRSELTEAGIATPDISAKNGVVHVINSVLMPE